MASMNEMAYVLQAWLPLIVWQQVDAPNYQKGYITIVFLAALLIATAFTIRYLWARELAIESRDMGDRILEMRVLIVFPVRRRMLPYWSRRNNWMRILFIRLQTTSAVCIGIRRPDFSSPILLAKTQRLHFLLVVVDFLQRLSIHKPFPIRSTNEFEISP